MPQRFNVSVIAGEHRTHTTAPAAMASIPSWANMRKPATSRKLTARQSTTTFRGVKWARKRRPITVAFAMSISPDTVMHPVEHTTSQSIASSEDRSMNHNHHRIDSNRHDAEAARIHPRLTVRN
jgi:hypothetical protein